MRSIHNLSGQNLLRHNLIEAHYRKIGYDCLVSDSANLHQLLNLVFSSKRRVVFHFLEIYSFSFIAFFSEFKFRALQRICKPISLLKLFYWFSKLFIKVVLFKILVRPNSLLILSSELRKNFICELGFNNPIIVVRNKPVVSKYDFDQIISKDAPRIKRIVLTGNLNNRVLFHHLCRKLENTDIQILCYGIAKDDKEWLSNQYFRNVLVYDSIASQEVPYLLRTSSFALCLYSELSYNQKYSASSKIFELLFFGAIPIVNSNPGLIEELTNLGAAYINCQDIIPEDLIERSYPNSLFGNEVCLFENEISILELNND